MRWGLLVGALLGSVFAAKAASDWQTFHDCVLIENPGNDADSFRVKAGDRELHLRLYFVDCPETSAATDADAKRIREQARHFGLTNMTRVVRYGKEAQDVAERLLAKPFVVHTMFARALGRSAIPRVYAMVTTVDGKDLGSLLVEQGYARAFGVKRTTPDGRPGDEFARRLQDLEMQAMLKRAGIWSEMAPDMIDQLREEQREEDADLKELRDRLMAEANAVGVVDLNTATSRQLQSIGGIGPVLASRILQGRPYQKVDDLLRVKGINRKLFEQLRPHLVVEVTEKPRPSSAEPATK